MPKSRHTPQRSCVACGLKMPKGQLIRIVKNSQGQIAVDTTGREPGRGAYLCRSPDCWGLALGKGALERSFRQSISAQDLEPVRTHYQQHLAPQDAEPQP